MGVHGRSKPSQQINTQGHEQFAYEFLGQDDARDADRCRPGTRFEYHALSTSLHNWLYNVPNVTSAGFGGRIESEEYTTESDQGCQYHDHQPSNGLGRGNSSNKTPTTMGLKTTNAVATGKDGTKKYFLSGKAFRLFAM